VNDHGLRWSVILRLLADIDLSEGDSARAMKRYQEALDLNQNDFRIFNGLGEVLFSLNSLERALESFKKALELKSVFSRYSDVGVVFASIGKKDEARDFFKRALFFMPTHSDAREKMEQIHK
jgi:Tfp pilus assembly protein PilF